MNPYTRILREVRRRLDYHNASGRVLEGLKIIEGPDFSINGEDQLPALTIVDIGFKEDANGNGSTVLSMFLMTSRKDNLCQFADADPPGLMEWVAKVQGAIESAPSANQQADTFLIPHNADFTVESTNQFYRNGLLKKSFTWSTQMAQITELSYMMQIDMNMDAVIGHRTKRLPTGY